MKNRVGLLVLASLVFAGSAINLPSQWIPQPLTSLVQNTAQAVASPEYDRTFGANWQSIRIFRLMDKMDRPLQVYINDAPSRLFQPQYMQYVTDGLSTWSKALDYRFSFVLTSDPQAADIRVNWVDSFPDRYTAGLATYRIGDADIRIKTIGVPDKDIKANIIHELGHALGIAGHSTDQNDIMVGMRRWKAGDPSYEPTLSRNDIRAIQRLYSKRWNKGEDLYVALRNENTQPGNRSVEVAVSPQQRQSSRNIQQDARVESYMSALRERINQNWAMTASRRGKPVIVRFQVDPRGELHDVLIRQSSGSGAVDTAAMQVIRHSVANLPMPQGYPANPMSIEIALR